MNLPHPCHTRTDPLFPSPSPFRAVRAQVRNAHRCACPKGGRMMVSRSRVHQLGWMVVMAVCLGLFLALSFRVHAVNSEVRLDERERSEEQTSELQSLMRISYAVFCLKKKKKQTA